MSDHRREMSVVLAVTVIDIIAAAVLILTDAPTNRTLVAVFVVLSAATLTGSVMRNRDRPHRHSRHIDFGDEAH